MTGTVCGTEESNVMNETGGEKAALSESNIQESLTSNLTKLADSLNREQSPHCFMLRGRSFTMDRQNDVEINSIAASEIHALIKQNMFIKNLNPVISTEQDNYQMTKNTYSSLICNQYQSALFIDGISIEAWENLNLDENSYIITDLKIFKSERDDNATKSFCALSTPNLRTHSDVYCTSLVDNVYQYLNIQGGNTFNELAERAQKGLSYLVLGIKKGFETINSLEQDDKLFCRGYANPIQLLFQNLIQEENKVLNELIKFDKAMGVTMFKKVDEAFQSCGLDIKKQEKTNIDVLNTCNFIETPEEEAERREKRFALLSFGENSGDTRGLAQTMNQNFQAVKTAFQNINKDLIELKAENKVEYLAEKQEANNLNEAAWLNFGIEIEIYLQNIRTELKDSLENTIQFCFTEMRKMSEKLRNIKETIDRELNLVSYANLMSRKERPRIVIRDDQITTWQQSTKLRSKNTFVLSCKATSKGTLRYNNDEVTNVTSRAVTIERRHLNVITRKTILSRKCLEQETECSQSSFVEDDNKKVHYRLTPDVEKPVGVQCFPKEVIKTADNEVIDCTPEEVKLELPFEILSGKYKGQIIQQEVGKISDLIYPDTETGRLDMIKHHVHTSFHRKVDKSWAALLNQTWQDVGAGEFTPAHVAGLGGALVTATLTILTSVCSCCWLCFQSKKDEIEIKVNNKTEAEEDETDKSKTKINRLRRLMRKEKKKNIRLAPDKRGYLSTLRKESGAALDMIQMAPCQPTAPLPQQALTNFPHANVSCPPPLYQCGGPQDSCSHIRRQNNPSNPFEKEYEIPRNWQKENEISRKFGNFTTGASVIFKEWIKKYIGEKGNKSKKEVEEIQSIVNDELALQAVIRTNPAQKEKKLFFSGEEVSETFKNKIQKYHIADDVLKELQRLIVTSGDYSPLDYQGW